ncbi:xanthine phosphoribosyltransferase [Desulforamulus hydrothermalis]|uniref:Xanthine phosphoribosyltransferase n=1 Tax=Desulforamulus hydrothermalis Lam5 = DSM 18033 TaxID=1121428 RepID=K8DX33_9FIRM|nr:xanthine phosphoribosyltransferase [Desulforamulus hydrothermalis]CCO06980.1 Xanthine phosphoribosyltransferase [Desulforamulus hydrothermalis Lam5 = DSM 18033]SHG98366.1 xanthine phosphoribosyltransferase [Desulforamulus hydrothermalis Lam5 = DSM 18033]
MQLLKEKILHNSQVVSDHILRVDSFINHMIDPAVMQEIGQEFARRFSGTQITKVLTVEASGIAVGLATAMTLEVPLLFAKKKRPSTLQGDCYLANIYSFTKNESVDIYVASQFLSCHDRVLIVDDFLARGEALKGLIRLVEQAGAHLAGVGIVIEKLFQGGGKALREQGVRIESLIRIKSMENKQLHLEE